MCVVNIVVRCSKVFSQIHQRLPLCSSELADGENTILERETSVYHGNRCEQRVGGKLQNTLLFSTHDLKIDTFENVRYETEPTVTSPNVFLWDQK